ncbi:hypothetical protein [Lacticaseibacillus absianus]|uniref:hypothetical protein n=1 Tax=Lacticaseibacillus absianus TaxID=2729623 RepID=UPI0015C8DB1F|nr:hypothetical protein [Lacticaseibacillus absianus]
MKKSKLVPISKIVAALLIGIGIGGLGTKLAEQSKSTAPSAYEIVKGPTRDRKIRYTPKTGISYAFDNPAQKLSVIVRHNNVYELLVLTSPSQP